MDIIGVEWRSARSTVGIVAVEQNGTWCAYIAAVPGNSEESDTRYTADFGCYLREMEGRAFFPHLHDKPYYIKA